MSDPQQLYKAFISDQHRPPPGLQLLCCRFSQTDLEGGLQVKFFAAPWPHLSPISVVDILLVAIIIYELAGAHQGHACRVHAGGRGGAGPGVLFFSRSANSPL